MLHLDIVHEASFDGRMFCQLGDRFFQDSYILKVPTSKPMTTRSSAMTGALTPAPSHAALLLNINLPAPGVLEGVLRLLRVQPSARQRGGDHPAGCSRQGEGHVGATPRGHVRETPPGIHHPTLCLCFSRHPPANLVSPAAIRRSTRLRTLRSRARGTSPPRWTSPTPLAATATPRRI